MPKRSEGSHAIGSFESLHALVWLLGRAHMHLHISDYSSRTNRAYDHDLTAGHMFTPMRGPGCYQYKHVFDAHV